MEIAISNIQNKIYNIRGELVMLDSDLALMYQTETKYINRAVNRNSDRFPNEFAFQLTEDEWKSLRFQIGTLNEKAGRGQQLKDLGRKWFAFSKLETKSVENIINEILKSGDGKISTKI